MSAEQTGWVALAGQYYTLNGIFEVAYTWDRRYWPDKAAAIKAGTLMANGTDDFNLAEIKDGTVVWWGWMDELHEIDDARDAARQHGWVVSK